MIASKQADPGAEADLGRSAADPVVPERKGAAVALDT